MFPERKPVQTEDNCFTIYRGQKALCAIQLLVDNHWRYILKDTDVLNVQLRNADNEIIISKNFTKENVDEITKQVAVPFSEEETAALTQNKYFISAFMDGYVVLSSQPVYVREVVENAD